MGERGGLPAGEALAWDRGLDSALPLQVNVSSKSIDTVICVVPPGLHVQCLCLYFNVRANPMHTLKQAVHKSRYLSLCSEDLCERGLELGL